MRDVFGGGGMRLLLVLLFVMGSSSHALEPVFFGPEFTFKAPSRETTYGLALMVRRVRKHLVNNQPDGEKFEERQMIKEGKTKWLSPNGWWFTTFKDQGVVEVTMSPGTPEYFRQFAGDM